MSSKHDERLTCHPERSAPSLAAQFTLPRDLFTHAFPKDSSAAVGMTGLSSDVNFKQGRGMIRHRKRLRINMSSRAQSRDLLTPSISQRFLRSGRNDRVGE